MVPSVVAAAALSPGPVEAVDARQQTRITSGGGSSLLGQRLSHDEELHFKGRSLTWVAGGMVRKQYTAAEPILEVAWCCFEDAGAAPVVCLLHQGALTLDASSGDPYTIPLPAGFARMWPLPQGLLLTDEAGRNPCVLLHPLERVHALAPGGGGAGRGDGWAEDERAVWSSREVPVLLTHSQRQRRVALWRLATGGTRSSVTFVPMADSQGSLSQQQQQPPTGAALQTPGAGLPPAAAGAAATSYKRSSLRLPDGSLSPAAFQPLPRSATPSMGTGKGYQLPWEEQPISFCLAYKQQWESGAAPDEAHLASDESGNPLLCLMSHAAQRVVALRLTGAGAAAAVEPAFSLPAASVAAVVATRGAGGLEPDGRHASPLPLRDLLVLHPGNGMLSLHVGERCVCNVSPPLASIRLPYTLHNLRAARLASEPDESGYSQAGGEGPPPAVAQDRHAAVASQPLDSLASVHSLGDALEHGTELCAIKDAVGNRVTLLRRDGSMQRMVLPFGEIAPLVLTSFRALRAVLPSDTWWRIYAVWLSETGACEGGLEDQWRVLTRLLTSWVQDPGCIDLPRRADVGGVLSSEATSTIGDEAPWKAATELAPGSVWQQLLTSPHHVHADNQRFLASQSQAEGLNQAPTRVATASPHLREAAYAALQALHSVYEDFKLDVQCWKSLPPLGTFLHQLAVFLGNPSFQDYYWRELSLGSISSPIPAASPPAAPPDIMRALEQLISCSGRGEVSVPLLAEQQSPCVQRSIDMLACYTALSDAASSCTAHLEWDNVAEVGQAMEGGYRRVVGELVQRKWTLARLDTLPFGVALPLRQALQQCRNNPPGDWPQAAYVLIGRNDIAASMAMSLQKHASVRPSEAIQSTTGAALKIGSLTTPTPFSSGVSAPALQKLQTVGVDPSEGLLLSSLNADPSLRPLPYSQRLQEYIAFPPVVQSSCDGMEGLSERAVLLRFGRDLRLLEVRRLLRSSVPVKLKTGAAPEVSDAEGALHQQIRLMVLAMRTMALPLGRGALTLGTLQPLPTEPLHIPSLNLAGRLPELNNAVANLDMTGSSPAPGGGAFAEFTAWPEFHNGVAAGLRLAPGGPQLTRTWVVYNKPAEPSYTHAGMLMALGVTGHLNCLAATDLYRYLSQEHDATIIGVLLGMASSKRYTMDSSVSKMLFLHLPTRHPSTYPELEMSSIVQASALLGVGLLYQGSAHRLMAEVMLEEIGRRPGTASRESGDTGLNLDQGVTQDREGYALAAGMALGLITLGQGRDAPGLVGVRLEERLRYFMLGGSEAGTVGSQRGVLAASGKGNANLTDGVFSPNVIGFDPTLGEPEARTTNLSRDTGTGRSGGAVAEELAAAQGSSQVVLEGELINLDVTSPAATVALGLMFLKTNDAAIAALFLVPDTLFALDFVRPEHLLIRVMMRALVLWDSVQPTEEWLNSQLPPILKGKKVLSAVLHPSALHDATSDYGALAHAHCCVLAGACLGMALRFAGTANAQAEAILRKHVLYFLKAKKSAPEPDSNSAAYINREALESCVSTAILALSIVMAGTGNLRTFKLLRGLRKRLAPSTAANAQISSQGSPPSNSLTYGAHLAVSMGLGFLFLGAGTLTFSTSPQSVAALVIATFPRFPQHTNDNRYHLQAFRHLYALATEARSVVAIDVVTKEPVYVPMELIMTEDLPQEMRGLRPVASVSKAAGDVLAGAASVRGQTEDVGQLNGYKCVAPCLLVEQEQAAEVRIEGPRYWPRTLKAASGLADLYATRTLYVQRKAGAQPYAADPSGVRSLLARMLSRMDEMSMDLVQICSTFGSDPFVYEFAECFLGDIPNSGRSSRLPEAARDFQSFCYGVAGECIAAEKSALLPYLWLYNMMVQEGLASDARRLAGGVPPSVWMRSLGLARTWSRGTLGIGSTRLCEASGDEDASGWALLLKPAFLESCWERFVNILDNRRTVSDLGAYFSGQQVEPSPEFKAYLTMFSLPSAHQFQAIAAQLPSTEALANTPVSRQALAQAALASHFKDLLPLVLRHVLACC